MSNFYIPDQPPFTEEMRRIEVEDQVHEAVVNPMFEKLLYNSVYLKRKLDESYNSLGGPNLPGNKVTDPDAQYNPVEKSGDETGQIFTADTPLKKGLYSVAIRLKVSDVSSAENILKLDITDGDKALTKYIKPQMLKKANTYTTIGCAAECTSGTLGITLSIDKVWTGQTVRVDYVTIAPAMVSISSL